MLRRSVNHRRSATVLLTGADVGASGLPGYAIAHALLILPIWTQLLRGLPFAPVTGVTFEWAYDASGCVRGNESLMHGVQFGGLMALTLVPAMLVNSAIRLGGVRVQESMAGSALAVALAIASAAASGGLLTGRRDAWLAFAVATSR